MKVSVCSVWMALALFTVKGWIWQDYYLEGEATQECDCV